MSTGVLEGQRLQISLELDLQFVSCPTWDRTHIFGRVRMHPQSLRHLFIPLLILMESRKIILPTNFPSVHGGYTVNMTQANEL